MARNMDELFDQLPAGRRRKIEKRAAHIMEEHMSLQELRRARELTQIKLAKTLGVTQKQISELERRTDMHLSTLRRTVEGMGGSLAIVAQFPDRAPVILTGISSEQPLR